MIQLKEERLQTIFQQGRDRHVLVVGDLMIDRYLWGNVSRISPEAPVPIINIEDEEIRFGGAANVANNLIGLNAIPMVVGTIGDDPWGEAFRKMLRDKQLTSDGLVMDHARPTTIKTRVIGNNQQVARVDREKISPIEKGVQQRMLNYIESVIDQVDSLILQDYNKGVLVPELVERIINLANQHGKIITVDPKFNNFFQYHNVTVFKPNKKETEEALALRLQTEEEVENAGRILLDKLNARAVLITLGQTGMALFEKNKGSTFMGTHAREVADVSGAGDTVIATLTFALTGRATISEAMMIANIAAGVVCGEVGVVPIASDQILEAFHKE